MESKEIWKDIPRYEGYYQASNQGRIKSLLFQSNVHNKKYPREKILKQKIDKTNSWHVDLWKDGKHKTYLVARLVATTFLDDLIETDMTVNHKDGNRLNNNIENLEWLTRGDNIRHAFDNGLMPYRKIEVIDKSTNKTVFTGSQTKASLFMGKRRTYISEKEKRNISENEKFIWRYSS